MAEQHPLSRTELLIGKEGLTTLRKKTVAVLGIGGVGSYAVEALARGGIGRLLLVDDDTVCLTNMNRQLHATMDTIGRNKVEVMAERVLAIAPTVEVASYNVCVTPVNVPDLLAGPIDYVIDALDTISAKIGIIEYCFQHRIPVISCMGTGNKLDPTKFMVVDLYKTRICPLARVMRHELRKRGVSSLKVVCSEEYPQKPLEAEGLPCKTACADHSDRERTCRDKRSIPASISFVPPVAGFILAGEAIKDLLHTETSLSQ